MPKALKYVLLAVASLIGLLAVALAIVAARFDPNDYKPLLIDRMRQDKQRVLAIPGAIQLSVFPRIGVQLGPLSLSEHAGTETFASVQSARISLALLPLLLRRQLVVDTIVVSGLRAKLVRNRDGSTSIDDLLGATDHSPATSPAPAPQPLAFDVAGIDISDAAITIDDRQSARRLALTQASITTGRLAPGAASDMRIRGHLDCNAPRLALDLALQGNLLLDPAQQHYAFSKLQADATGSVATLAGLKATLRGSADITLVPLRLALADIDLSLQGTPQQPGVQGALDASMQVPQFEWGDERIAAQKIAAKLVFKEGTRTLQVALALPSFSGSKQAFTVASVNGDVRLDDGPLQAQAVLAGRIDGSADKAGNMLLSSPQTMVSIDGKQGAASIKGSVSTPWSMNLQTQQLELARIAADLTLPNPKSGLLAFKAGGTASVDLARHALQASLAGTLDQSAFQLKLGMPSFTPAVYSIDLGIDQIDLDRYRSAAAAHGNGPAKAAPTPAAAAPGAAPDLSALRGLHASASVRVDALKAANLKLAKLRVDLRAAGGKLELSPLMAELYRGSAAGSVLLDASAAQPHLRITQALSGIDVGALQLDALGRTRLDGRGDVAIDVTAQGASVGALLKGLNGSARLALKDGMVHGVNIAQAIRSAKARLGLAGGQQAGTGSEAEGSDFSELTGSFKITNGVARNDDLLAKTPLLRISGNGNIDLADSRLDYTVGATVVATLQGQGGPELQALRGQTIPLRLKGPFNAVGYSIDVGAMLKDVARQKLGDKLIDLLRK